MTKQRAFTLIELLVVIAIIAILAAILFPVFAQAKAAAKYAVGISNVKQIELANIMYSGDYDDMRVATNIQDIDYAANGAFIAVVDEWSWKQTTAPYAKSTPLYADTFNPAAKYLDDHSDPAVRHFQGWNTVNVPTNLTFNRSYYHANLGTGTTSPAPFVNDDAVSLTTFQNPSGTFDIIEAKDFYQDEGPYSAWTQNVDSDTGYPVGVQPVTGLSWNLGAGKWNNMAMGVAFIDGHAKRQSFGATCAVSWYNEPLTNGGTDFFNIPAGEFKTDVTWQNDWGWANSFCSSLPPAFN